MKKCEKVEEKIILYLEELLDPVEKNEIKRHIENCEKCKSYFEYIKELLTQHNKVSQNYLGNLTEKIIKKIEKYKENRLLRIIRVKKFTFSFILVFIFITLFLNIFEDQIRIVRYLHLFKDYHIIKNLDTLKELTALEEEYE